MALFVRQGGHATVTPDDHGPLVAIATWFLMVAMIMAVFIRVAIRFVITRAPGTEDATIFVAMLVGVAQSIAVSIGIQYGLGQRQQNLSLTSLARVEKTQYTSDLLFILTISLAKISVLQLLERLAVVRSHKRIAKITMIVVGVYTVPAFLAIALQCGTSEPWNTQSSQCIDIFSVWVYIAILDVLTELVMIALPFIMMHPVQVAKSKKAVIIIAFIFRILVIAATITRLFYLHSALSSPDVTFSIVNADISTQCVSAISIISACIPCLKPFLDGFDSGMLGISLRRRANGREYSNNYKMRTFSSAKESALRSRSQEEENKGLGHSAAIVATDLGSRRVNLGAGHETNESVGSVKSDEMIITRTDHWHVQYDEGATPVGIAMTPSAEEGEGEGPRTRVHSTL
ncbi:hypothetical protein MMC20_004805 [Loxospora ochrophaea]|nr:hypothetical protein [Loxospora ochrophaea]